MRWLSRRIPIIIKIETRAHGQFAHSLAFAVNETKIGPSSLILRRGRAWATSDYFTLLNCRNFPHPGYPWVKNGTGLRSDRFWPGHAVIISADATLAISQPRVQLTLTYFFQWRI